MEFADRDEVKVWIKKNQLGRRNLAAFLRAEYQMDIDEWEQRKAKARENQIGALKQFRDEEDDETVFVSSQKREQSINTTKELAAKIGVGEQTASRIIKIREKAPEEVKEKLRTGDVQS